jgi:hypothetical protein
VHAEWIPSGRAAFVPRCRGFGARLLGLDAATARTDGQELIRVTRQERDLLRPDLTLVSADRFVLTEAIGTRPRADWAALELPDPTAAPALGAVLGAARALAPESPVGVLLAGPLALASFVSGQNVPRALDTEWEDLVDACVIVLCDAASAVVDAGAHVVIEEPTAPSAAVLALYSPLWNLLRHRRRPAFLVVLDGDPAGFDADGAVAAVAHGAAVARWDATVETPSAVSGVASPEICADASPEHTQSLVQKARELR